VAALIFLGATRTITGSKDLVDHRDYRILSDCGLFQELKELRLRSWERCPVPLESIDAVVPMHAHLDHISYLPGLVAQGVHERVFCTGGTADAVCRDVVLIESTFKKLLRERLSWDAQTPAYAEWIEG